MSLLNQVLQDLDAREAEAPATTVLSPVDTAPAPSAEKAPPRDIDWERVAVWGSVALLVAAYLVYLLIFEPTASPEPRVVPAPKVRVLAVADTPPQEPAENAAESVAAEAEAEPAVSRSPIEPDTAEREAANPGPVEASVPTDAEEPAVATVEAAPVADTAAGDTEEAAANATPIAPVPPASVEHPVRPAENPPKDPPATVPSRQAPVSPGIAGKSLVAKRPSVGPPVLAPAAWFAEAKRYWAQGRIASAEERLRKALKYRPQHLAAREMLIALLVRGDRLAEARQQIDLGLKQHAQQPSLVMLKARLQAQNGEVLAAAVTLEQSGLAESGEESVLAMLASLYQQLGHHQESVVAYRRLVAQAPDKGGYWAGLGLGLEALGDSAMALQAYRRALAVPGLPDSVSDYVRERRNLLE